MDSINERKYNTVTHLCLMMPSTFGTSNPMYSDIPTSVSMICCIEPSGPYTAGFVLNNAWLGGSRFSSSSFFMSTSMASCSCSSRSAMLTTATVLSTLIGISPSTPSTFGRLALGSSVRSGSRARDLGDDDMGAGENGE